MPALESPKGRKTRKNDGDDTLALILQLCHTTSADSGEEIPSGYAWKRWQKRCVCAFVPASLSTIAFLCPDGLINIYYCQNAFENTAVVNSPCLEFAKNPIRM